MNPQAGVLSRCWPYSAGLGIAGLAGIFTAVLSIYSHIVESDTAWVLWAASVAGFLGAVTGIITGLALVLLESWWARSVAVAMSAQATQTLAFVFLAADGNPRGVLTWNSQVSLAAFSTLPAVIMVLAHHVRGRSTRPWTLHLARYLAFGVVGAGIIQITVGVTHPKVLFLAGSILSLSSFLGMEAAAALDRWRQDARSPNPLLKDLRRSATLVIKGLGANRPKSWRAMAQAVVAIGMTGWGLELYQRGKGIMSQVTTGERQFAPIEGWIIESIGWVLICSGIAIALGGRRTSLIALASALAVWILGSGALSIHYPRSGALIWMDRVDPMTPVWILISGTGVLLAVLGLASLAHRKS